MKPLTYIACLLAFVMLMAQPLMAQTDTGTQTTTDYVISPTTTSQIPMPASTNAGAEEFSNYHPLVVHFPIVLLIIAASIGVINLVLRKVDFDNLVIVLAVAGAAGAIVATKFVHPHVMRNIDPAIRAILREHDKWADLTMMSSVIASILLLLGRFVIRKPIVKYLGVLVLVVSAVTVSLSGHEGAKLVHQQGVGVKGNMLNTSNTPPPPGEHDDHE